MRIASFTFVGKFAMNPLSRLSSANQNRLAWFLAIANGIMLWLFSGLRVSWLPTYTCVDETTWSILRSRFTIDAAVATRFLQLDLVFIFLYPSLVSLLCVMVARRLSPKLARAANYVSLFALLSVPIDLYETLSQLYGLPDGIPADRLWLTCTCYKLKAVPAGLGALFIVGGLVGIHRDRVSAILRYAYYLRIPILLFGVLLVFPLASSNLTVRGLLSTSDWIQLTLNTFLLCFAVTNCVLAARLILRLAGIRFDLPKVKMLTADTVLAIFALGLTVAFASKLIANTEVATTRSILAVLLGVAAAVMMIISVRKFRARLLDAPDWLMKLGPGYIDRGGRFQTGHPLAVAAATALMAIYIFAYYVARPFTSHWQVPSLAYVFLILMLLTTILSGITFFLDRYRVPVLLAFIAYTAFNYRVLDIDHFFHASLTEQNRPTITQAFRAREALRKPKMIAVVCASGGGIWSAAWTTRVLTGLQKELGARFPSSIFLTSSTSGGSAGLYFYLNSNDHRGAVSEDRLEMIARAAAASSLEATAWGLAYPDFTRLFFPYIFFNPFEGRAWEKDRAWAIERMWEKTLLDSLGIKSDSLSGWARRAASGTLPGVVFNTTIAENGGLNLVTTLDLEQVARREKVATLDSLYIPRSEDGKRRVDISTTTAARLSATFPYVTPISRPFLEGVRTPALEEWHLADGGYFDNFGVVAAISWIDYIIENGILGPDTEVMIIQIRASTPAPVTSKDNKGWLYAIVGPLKTVMGVWSTSQAIRNDFEIELLQERHRKESGREIRTVVIQPTMEVVPLSWYLSPADKDSIDAQWEAWRTRHGDQLESLRPLVAE